MDEYAYEYDEEPPVDRAGDGSGGESLPGAVFGSLEAFVCEYLLAVYRRPVSATSTTWCAEWWRHREACVRLDALWRSWEHLRLDAATGMSVWLRDHADHHMSVLLSADGPFKGCTPERHAQRPVSALPSAPVPDAVRIAPADGVTGVVRGL
jgi:hypothetical protein